MHDINGGNLRQNRILPAPGLTDPVGNVAAQFQVFIKDDVHVSDTKSAAKVYTKYRSVGGAASRGRDASKAKALPRLLWSSSSSGGSIRMMDS